MKVSTQWPIERFLNRLASSDPAPGGGSAAALAGSLGAALGSMVCSILLGRRGLRASERKRLEQDRQSLEKARRRLTRLVQEDAQAYQTLVLALRTQRGIDRARGRALQCPLHICEEVGGASRIMRGLSRRAGPTLGSDVEAGRALLKGAFESALVTVEVNLRQADRDSKAELLRRRLIRLRNSLER